MPWGRCDDGYYRHRKVAELDEDLLRKGCVALYWLAVSWANDQRTDGRVTVSAVRTLGADKAEADELVRVGLWEEDGKAYRIHDFLDFNKSVEQLDHEKAQRTLAGIAGASARWRAASDVPNETPSEVADGEDAPYPVPRTPLPSNPSPAPPLASESNDPADVYWSLTGRFPKDGALSWIDGMTSKYGSQPTIRSLVQAHQADRSLATLLGRTDDLLRAGARELDRKERTAEEASLKQKRAIPKVVEPWKEDYRRALEERYGPGEYGGAA